MINNQAPAVPNSIGWLVVVLLLVNMLPTTASAQPFSGDINRWVAQDTLAPPEPGAILFTGSSSIRRYEQLTRDFADYHVIQRGFGGSQFEDLVGYADEIVLPYRPAAIVVWEGTNDINAGESAAEVVADYEAFVAKVHSSLPGTPIFYLGIMPTPGRFACCETRNTEANTAIAARAANNPALHYIDLPAAFRALSPPTGPDFNALFVDNIHLNRAGYDLWTSLIRPQLMAVVPPNKEFSPNPLSPRPGVRLLFDFGPSNPQDGDATVGPDVRGNHWNNWHAAEGGIAVNAGERITNLVDTTGAATGINLTITGGFATNGKLQGGLLQADPALLGDFAVATATQDYFFSSADNRVGGGNDDRPGGFMLEGLDPERQYEFRFFGSRAVSSLRTTEYRVYGQNTGVAKLVTSGPGISAAGTGAGNDDEIALVSGIRPDGYGQIFVDLTLLRGDFAYLNAMEMRVLEVPEPASLGTLGWLGVLLAAPLFGGRGL
ncbi:GDSL-type esterase/lipase family protein [Botrimarina hoheduenensis]|nr:GDSL-type esterase/lipase family protein [Botrimarina hoheduenensis]